MISTTRETLSKILNPSEVNTAYYLPNIHPPFPPLLSDPNPAQDDNGSNKKQLHPPASFTVRVSYGMRFRTMTCNSKSLMHSQESILKDEDSAGTCSLPSVQGFSALVLLTFWPR